MIDPFEAMGLPAAMDLDADELEQRYLQLSRDSHPDHNGGGVAGQVAVLERAAQINDAYRILRDPWLRARALIERNDPEALEKSKTMCPIFLMDALEQAEAVATATDDQRAALRSTIEQSVTDCQQELRSHLENEAWEDAATTLHKASYHRKALDDLDQDH